MGRRGYSCLRAHGPPPVPSGHRIINERHDMGAGGGVQAPPPPPGASELRAHWCHNGGKADPPLSLRWLIWKPREAVMAHNHRGPTDSGRTGRFPNKLEKKLLQCPLENAAVCNGRLQWPGSEKAQEQNGRGQGAVEVEGRGRDKGPDGKSMRGGGGAGASTWGGGGGCQTRGGYCAAPRGAVRAGPASPSRPSSCRRRQVAVPSAGPGRPGPHWQGAAGARTGRR